MKYFKVVLLCSALFTQLLTPYIANASEIEFSGFATITGGITFEEDELYEGYDDQLNFSNRSLFAFQVSKDLGDDWGITAQFIARGANAWDVNAEWAYLSYDASDEWRILFGRQRAPFYMYSDYLDVSYAYHWIKPPGGVYSLPFDLVDGVGSVYSNSLGEFDSTFHLVYGRNNEDSILLGTVQETDYSDMFSVAWTLNKDWFTFRASFLRTELLIPFKELAPLFDGWRATGTFANIADELDFTEDIGTFASLGFIVDYESFLLIAEYAQVRPGDNLFPDQDSYYISLGKRFDDIMWHITFGADEDVADFTILNNVPEGVDPGLDFLRLSTNGLLVTTEEDSQYITIGLKWDVSSSVVFKVEYTDYSDDHILGVDASLLQFALTTVF